MTILIESKFDMPTLDGNTQSDMAARLAISFLTQEWTNLDSADLTLEHCNADIQQVIERLKHYQMLVDKVMTRYRVQIVVYDEDDIAYTCEIGRYPTSALAMGVVGLLMDSAARQDRQAQMKEA